MLKFIYSNSYGTVTFYGGGSHSFLIREYEGLSLIERDYSTTTYAEEDGQDTLYSRAMPRAVTISADVIDKDAGKILRDAIKVLGREGYLYVTDGDFERRIYCNQVTIADPERVLRGQISSFVVQFVCDNPYFEDTEETTRIIYGREKNITTPFTLPRAFALINKGAYVYNYGDKAAEPKIIITCNETLSESSYVDISLTTSAGTISLRINDYTPISGDVITIDIKERTVTGTKSGDLINKLSDASFLKDFVIRPSPESNYISVAIKNVTTDIGVECKYRTLYNEAVVI